MQELTARIPDVSLGPKNDIMVDGSRHKRRPPKAKVADSPRCAPRVSNNCSGFGGLLMRWRL